MISNVRVVGPALHDDLIARSMEERVREELGPFVNQAMDNLLCLGMGNVELAGGGLDRVAKVGLGVEAGSNLWDTYGQTKITERGGWNIFGKNFRGLIFVCQSVAF